MTLAESFFTEIGAIDSYHISSDQERIHLLFSEKHAAQASPRLFHTFSKDTGFGWSPPVAVDVGALPPHNPSFSNPPRLAASGSSVVAAWTTKGAGFGGRGPLQAVVSEDLGRTWRPAPPPAPVEQPIDQSFLDLAADPSGVFHLVWLDARTGNKWLRYARLIDLESGWTPALTLDDETCECCWNRLVVDGNWLFVLYRNIRPRDMALLGSGDGGWSWAAPTTVGRFDWYFEGCPHVGGGLAVAQTASELLLHATVWTGARPLRWKCRAKTSAALPVPRPPGSIDVSKGRLAGRIIGVLLPPGAGATATRGGVRARAERRPGPESRPRDGRRSPTGSRTWSGSG